jgi:hypothetical protein
VLQRLRRASVTTSAPAEAPPAANPSGAATAATSSGRGPAAVAVAQQE